jgi:TIGR03009 family protein
MRLSRREDTLFTTALETLVGHLRQITCPAEAAELTDAQLLQRWLTQRDEPAFAVLLRRHGPAVFAVCRRVLRHDHDAEDAFQATFLILARKAATIGRREAVGSWLFKVAYRVALRAQAGTTARSQQPFVDQATVTDPDELARRDLQAVLDEELSRLPERWRAAFVLCYLEGRTNAEAARELGCPPGTLSSWLTRAKVRLRGCLTRRGLAPSAGFLAVSATSAVPVPLAAVTIQAAMLFAVSHAAAPTRAAALAKGVIRPMLATKVCSAAALVLAAGLLLLGGALWARGPRTAANTEGVVIAPTRPGGDPGNRELPTQTLPSEQQPAADLPPSPLDAILRRWQEASRKVKGVSAQCTRTNNDKASRNTHSFIGTVRYAPPDLGVVELARTGQPGVVEKHLSDGKAFYEYVTVRKELLRYPLADPKPGQELLSPFPPLLLGARAEEVRRRYALKLVKDDQWYVYVEILPLTAADKEQFKRGRLVLDKRTFLPRQLWLELDDHEVSWDFLRIVTDRQIDRKEFATPVAPQGWKLVPRSH